MAEAISADYVFQLRSIEVYGSRLRYVDDGVTSRTAMNTPSDVHRENYQAIRIIAS